MLPSVGDFSMSHSNSLRGASGVQILLIFGPALAFAPFGIPAITFWIYVSASLVFIIGNIRIFRELPHEHGVDKILPFGRLFFAIPIAVFGSEHFTATANVASLVPRWIPAPTFWVYLTGLAFICAAVSIAILVQARLAAALVGMTMLIFVLVMDVPAVVAQPGNRFFGPWPSDNSPSAVAGSRSRCRPRALGRDNRGAHSRPPHSLPLRDSSWGFQRYSMAYSIYCILNTCLEYR